MIGANHEIALPPFLGCTDVDLTDVELVPAVGLVSAMIVIFSCFNLKSELKKYWVTILLKKNIQMFTQLHFFQQSLKIYLYINIHFKVKTILIDKAQIF